MLTNQQAIFTGQNVVEGVASGEVLYSEEPISMWGGIDPLTGIIIDTHHPLRGESVSGKILVIPSGRGSCSGSGAIFEMLLGDLAPAALVFCHEEIILALGTIIAGELYDRSIPIVEVTAEEHEQLANMTQATVIHGSIFSGVLSDEEIASLAATMGRSPVTKSSVQLSDDDQRMLDGEFGAGAQAAMRVTVRAAEFEGATELIDVEMAHIDGNFYQGPGSLKFAEKLRDLGAVVRVPATMNSLKIDRANWRKHGIAESLGEPSEALADAYVAMGVQPTYTCAPYLLSPKPEFGQQIVWAESNAVLFANSVLGARTLKYPDYLELLIAITGRAPASGTHLPMARRATVHCIVTMPEGADESFYPLLGYFIGKMATNDIPVVSGLEHSGATEDDLKAFGAAFGTTSAAPMFHIVGITPEAETVSEATGGLESLPHTVTVTPQDLLRTHAELNSATTQEVGLVSFGNPHFSLAEIARLAALCEGQEIRAGVELKITCGREIHRQAVDLGYAASIENFGGEFLLDTCWCFISQPVVPAGVSSVITNSGKHAHYGPAQVGTGMHFGSFEDCVNAALTGRAPSGPPAWLSEEL